MRFESYTPPVAGPHLLEAGPALIACRRGGERSFSASRFRRTVREQPAAGDPPAGFFALRGRAPHPGPERPGGGGWPGTGARGAGPFALTAVMVPYPLNATIHDRALKVYFTLESAAASHIDPTPGLVTGISYVGRRPGTSRYRGFPRQRKRYAAGIPGRVRRRRDRATWSPTRPPSRPKMCCRRSDSGAPALWSRRLKLVSYLALGHRAPLPSPQ